MKKLIFILCASMMLVLMSCNNEGIGNHEIIKDGAFIHISHGSDDLHRALMGLQMAEKMSEDKDVLVYFDISGIEIVLNEFRGFYIFYFPKLKDPVAKIIE